MQVFLKWTLRALLFLAIVVVCAIARFGFELEHAAVVTVFILLGSVIMGFVFYLLEVKFIPRRLQRIQRRLTDLFGAQPLSANETVFQINGIEFLTHISFDISISGQGGGEIIAFHIPRVRIDSMTTRPNFTYIPDACQNIETYRVYQTNGLGLSLARNRIFRRLANV